MASTNKTVNYELSQFEGTDKPSWEADYNADMLAIDTNLKAVSDIANGASGDISTLDGRLTTAEDNISTNANDIDALEGRADALEAGQTSDDSRLDALEAEQIVQNTAIESNTRLGYNLARPYDSASTYSVGAYVLFQDTLYKCTTAVSTGEAFDPNKWLAIKATDEIAAGGTTAQIIEYDITNFETPYITAFSLIDMTTNTRTTPTPENVRILSGSRMKVIKYGNLIIFKPIISIGFDNILVSSGSMLNAQYSVQVVANSALDTLLNSVSQTINFDSSYPAAVSNNSITASSSCSIGNNGKSFHATVGAAIAPNSTMNINRLTISGILFSIST